MVNSRSAIAALTGATKLPLTNVQSLVEPSLPTSTAPMFPSLAFRHRTFTRPEELITSVFSQTETS